MGGYSTEGQTFYWSILTADDSIKSLCANSDMTGQVGGFQNLRVCVQVVSFAAVFRFVTQRSSPSLWGGALLEKQLRRRLVCKRFLLFFPTPSPLFYLRHLTLVPRILLLNRTETLATQATSVSLCERKLVATIFWGKKRGAESN